jgi:hypothetical protein
MHERFVDLLLECLVLPFQFRKVSLDRHWRGSPSYCSGN